MLLPFPFLLASTLPLCSPRASVMRSPEVYDLSVPVFTLEKQGAVRRWTKSHLGGIVVDASEGKVTAIENLMQDYHQVDDCQGELFWGPIEEIDGKTLKEDLTFESAEEEVKPGEYSGFAAIVLYHPNFKVFLVFDDDETTPGTTIMQVVAFDCTLSFPDYFDLLISSLRANLADFSMLDLFLTRTTSNHASVYQILSLPKFELFRYIAYTGRYGPVDVFGSVRGKRAIEFDMNAVAFDYYDRDNEESHSHLQKWKEVLDMQSQPSSALLPSNTDVPEGLRRLQNEEGELYVRGTVESGYGQFWFYKGSGPSSNLVKLFDEYCETMFGEPWSELRGYSVFLVSFWFSDLVEHARDLPGLLHIRFNQEDTILEGNKGWLIATNYRSNKFLRIHTLQGSTAVPWLFEFRNFARWRSFILQIHLTSRSERIRIAKVEDKKLKTELGAALDEFWPSSDSEPSSEVFVFGSPILFVSFIRCAGNILKFFDLDGDDGKIDLFFEVLNEGRLSRWNIESLNIKASVDDDILNTIDIAAFKLPNFALTDNYGRDFDTFVLENRMPNQVLYGAAWFLLGHHRRVKANEGAEGAALQVLDKNSIRGRTTYISSTKQQPAIEGKVLETPIQLVTVHQGENSARPDSLDLSFLKYGQLPFILDFRVTASSEKSLWKIIQRVPLELRRDFDDPFVDLDLEFIWVWGGAEGVKKILSTFESLNFFPRTLVNPENGPKLWARIPTTTLEEELQTSAANIERNLNVEGSPTKRKHLEFAEVPNVNNFEVLPSEGDSIQEEQTAQEVGSTNGAGQEVGSSEPPLFLTLPSLRYMKRAPPKVFEELQEVRACWILLAHSEEPPEGHGSLV